MLGYTVFTVCALFFGAVVFDSLRARRKASMSKPTVSQSLDPLAQCSGQEPEPKREMVKQAMSHHYQDVAPASSPSELLNDRATVYSYFDNFLAWIGEDDFVYFMSVDYLTDFVAQPARAAIRAVQLTTHYKPTTDYVVVRGRPQFVDREAVYQDENGTTLYWIDGGQVKTVNPRPSTPFLTIQELLQAVADKKIEPSVGYTLNGHRMPKMQVYTYTGSRSTVNGKSDQCLCWWSGGSLIYCPSEDLDNTKLSRMTKSMFMAEKARFTPTDEFVIVAGRVQRTKKEVTEAQASISKPSEGVAGKVYCGGDQMVLWWVDAENGCVMSMSSVTHAINKWPNYSASRLVAPEFKVLPNWVISRQGAYGVPVDIDNRQNVYQAELDPNFLYFLDLSGQHYLKWHKNCLVLSTPVLNKEDFRKQLETGYLRLVNDYVVENADGKLRARAVVQANDEYEGKVFFVSDLKDCLVSLEGDRVIVLNAVNAFGEASVSPQLFKERVQSGYYVLASVAAHERYRKLRDAKKNLRFYLWKGATCKDQFIYIQDGQSLRRLSLADNKENGCEATVSEFQYLVDRGHAVEINSEQADVLRKNAVKSDVYISKSGVYKDRLLMAVRGTMVQYLVLSGDFKGMRGFSEKIKPQDLADWIASGEAALTSAEQTKTFWENSNNVYVDSNGDLLAHTGNDLVRRLKGFCWEASLTFYQLAYGVEKGKYVPASLEQAATYWAALGHLTDRAAA